MIFFTIDRSHDLNARYGAEDSPSIDPSTRANRSSNHLSKLELELRPDPLILIYMYCFFPSEPLKTRLNFGKIDPHNGPDWCHLISRPLRSDDLWRSGVVKRGNHVLK